jgi:pimeloyl-ACP methyl ester carboxylesterase
VFSALAGLELVRKDYLTLANGRQVHFRQAGQGAPVVMLHPSPLSSAFLVPLMEYLSPDFNVIALDTPGYGDSDPLESPGDTLEPYVDVIGEVLEQLGLESALLYGNATGTQLAIESAKQFPERLAGIVLENAAAFTDAEREAMLGPYFPDLAPQDDGSHLSLVWRMARQTFQFFPWWDTSEQARYSEAEPPETLVQATAMAYLRAGPDYARAYRAAFVNERPEQLAAVAVPVSVILWQDSMLLDYSRRLQQAEMPDNIEFIDAGSGIEARYNAVRTALQGHRER